MKGEIMYNLNSIVVVLILLTTILVFYEISFRVGRFHQRRTAKEIKSQTNTVLAGILGLMALLLGFTFNMALTRFDSRSNAVTKEVNAIGTAVLRTNALPEPYDSVTYCLLQKYIDMRIEISSIDLTKSEQRNEINHKTNELQNEIWSNAMKAVSLDPSPVTTGLFVQALNDVFDARGERNDLLQRHVPEVILFLLFIVFIISSSLMGYSSGLDLKRAYIPTIIFNILVILVVFMIIDLDRPKRGIIKVNQDGLHELKNSFNDCNKSQDTK